MGRLPSSLSLKSFSVFMIRTRIHTQRNGGRSAAFQPAGLGSAGAYCARSLGNEARKTGRLQRTRRISRRNVSLICFRPCLKIGSGLSKSPSFNKPEAAACAAAPLRACHARQSRSDALVQSVKLKSGSLPLFSRRIRNPPVRAAHIHGTMKPGRPLSAAAATFAAGKHL